MAADYMRLFAIPDVVETHEHFQRLDRLLARLEAIPSSQRSDFIAARTRLRAIYRQFNQRLDEIARSTAIDADEQIKERLDATAKRPDSQNPPQLRDNIKSTAIAHQSRLATGVVGVASIKQLDKTVNPYYREYGPYWEAQEEGSRAAVGKRVRGYFYGPGFGSFDVPRRQYAGGGGPHPIFVTAKRLLGPRGGKGGPGIIRRPVRARHFIRDGANQARSDWRKQVRALQTQTSAELIALARSVGL